MLIEVNTINSFEVKPILFSEHIYVSLRFNKIDGKISGKCI